MKKSQPTNETMKKVEKDGTFHFECSRSGECCRHMEIFLNPYDILRMAEALGMTTIQLIQDHVLFLENKQQGILKPVLKAAREGVCAFNSNRLCKIHRDRPLPCRLFPIARMDEDYHLQQVSYCKGLSSRRKQDVASYIQEEEAQEHLEAAKPYHRIMKTYVSMDGSMDLETRDLFHKVLYDFDLVFGRGYPGLTCFDKSMLAIESASFILESVRKNGDTDSNELLAGIYDKGDHFYAKMFVGKENH